MGNGLILDSSCTCGGQPVSGVVGRHGQELASLSRHLTAFVLARTLLTTFTALAAEKGAGVAIYTTLDHGSDETAIAIPFIKAERFASVTNVTTEDGKSLRVTNNQMKELVFPPDLTTATAVDAAGIAALRQKLAELQALQKRFPRAHIQLAPVINELGQVVRLLDEGNVLVTGRLLSRDDYETQAAANRAKTVDLTVNEVVYKGAKLTSVSGEKILIMHSGGVASVTVGQLSDDQIARLNGTSKTASIDRNAINLLSAKAAKPPTTTVGGNDTAKMPSSGASTQSATSVAGNALPTMPENASGSRSPASTTESFNTGSEPTLNEPTALNIDGIIDGLETESQLFGFELSTYADLFGSAADFTASILAQKGTGDTSDYSRLAAAIAQKALTAASIRHREMKAVALRASADGKHVLVPPIEELVEQNVEGAVGFANYDRLVLAMSFIADNRLGAEARNRHLLLIQEMAEQASQEESNALQARMRTNAQEDLIRQGFSVEEAKVLVTGQERRAGSSEGAAAMLRGLKDFTISALAQASVLEETRTRQGKQIEYYRKTVGIEESHSSLLKTFYMTFGCAERERIAQALAEGDMDGLDKMFQEPDVSSLLEGGNFSAETFNKQLQEGGTVLGKQLGFFNTEALLAKTLRNNVSVSEERAYYRDYAAAFTARKAKK